MKKVIITILIFISSLVLIEITFDLVSLKKKSEKIKTLNIIKTSYHDLKLEYIDVPVFSKYGAIEPYKNDLILSIGLILKLPLLKKALILIQLIQLLLSVAAHLIFSHL